MIRAFVFDLVKGLFYAAVYALATMGFGAWLWGAW